MRRCLTPGLRPLRPVCCRIKAQRLPHDGKPATEVVELGAGPSPDDAYKARRLCIGLGHAAPCCPPDAATAFMLCLG